MAGTRRPEAIALLVVLLPVTVWLWGCLVFLLQIEARNRLAGSPGESSPLYLALLGLPAVALASAACLAAALGVRRRNTAQDVARALAAAGALCLLGVLSLSVVPSYVGAMRELVTLPWRALLVG
jgi:hypothetical protein